MFRRLRYDINVIKERDPAARNSFEVLLLYPGLHAVIWHRLAHFLYRHHWFLLARIVSQWSRFWTGIEIHPGAKIGKGLFIDHGSGVVIGETTEIGDDCTIYQGATLGGTGKESGKRHPTLGNNVLVGSGARILGPFKVGDNARIASNAVVLEEVPDDATAVGVPARIVRIKGEKVDSAKNLDQVHVPNPVEQEIQQLARRICQLEYEVEKANKNKKNEG
ncbi:serine O-acetyltransferase [[Clostridium] methylpentosum DSM 5476]|jgi:serine O-acetyltransferase|uniref:Serine acetyltransferase n=1 Tax=[Clostridium] methylpentosum DSM 5476 TaxID=537013 RepID=C0ECB3_9FIRM|nr:serine O-acetyltransferase [[Clostridium] methylpentosum DSM 5476]MDY3989543.1 serine O-acetyltransferase EpsC [Massilioclostridium sp.]MEE1492007.1 serine O-acetyltransferase EpsC [Massilioclostridium sp.]